MANVVNATRYLMVLHLSVTLTVKILAVILVGLANVETRQNIVPVRIVLTIGLYTGTGENQEVGKSGGMTEGVVVLTPYLTVHLQSAILTVKSRAARI